MTNPVKLLSDDALREIEALANAATDGPWQRGGNYWDINTVTADAGKYFIADCHKNPLSAEFIAHAREDIPALCQTVRALRQQNQELKAIVDIGTSDDPGTALTKIHKIQNDAATAMRDRCVAKVTELYEAWCLEAQHRGNDLKNLRGVKGRAKADAAESIITTLKSLTLEGEQEKR